MDEFGRYFRSLKPLSTSYKTAYIIPNNKVTEDER